RHEVLREPIAQMPCGSRVAREQVQCTFAFLDSATRDPVSQKHFGAKVMPGRVEVKSARTGRRNAWRRLEAESPRTLRSPELGKGSPGHRRSRVPGPAAELRGKTPTGQNVRQRNHILLRVRAIYAHRVKFHQFARIILVDPLELSPGACAAGRR